MRTFVLAIALASLLSPIASASMAHPQALVIDRVGQDTTIVTWTPLVGATSYTIYKGETSETLSRVEHTSTTFFIDLDGHEGDLYQIVGSSIFGEQAIEGPASGDCLSTSSNLRVSVSAENCLKGI